MSEKRIFTSIDLPPELKDHLKLYQKPEIRWIKWTKLENLHITLNFLGDLDQQEINSVTSVIQDVVPLQAKFPLLISSVSLERDMLWLVPEKNDALELLQEKLKEKFKASRIGKRERRPYSPHILFAKSKTGRPMTWQPEKFEPLEWAVDAVNLYESQLTPEAATHILIERFPLT